ncbi:MAG: cell division protein FtsQ [Bacteroides sp.]|nr:cell division protein FtsQ [Bacteroides sp.]
MLKKILLTLLLTLVAAYIVLAVTAFNREPVGNTCLEMQLKIRDTLHAGFITREEVASMLDKHQLNPLGCPLAEVRTKALEEVLSRHPLIDKVECYKTPGGILCVEVAQRIPVLRVMNGQGESYYVDNKGTVMPPDAKCVAHLAVATGHVEQAMALGELYRFALFLREDHFWNAQIEQIHVLPDKSVELVPRVGRHIIYLGPLTGYEQKLERVREFYERALNRVGWNKYSRISVEFGNQVICTKRE